VVLEVGGHHRAVVQDGERVAGALAGLRLGALPGRPVGVEVADDGGHPAQPLGGEIGRELGQRHLGGGHEGLPEDQVLDRISGEYQLGEGDEVGAERGGLGGVAAYQGAVVRDGTHGGIDLCESYPQRRHVPIVPQPYPCRTTGIAVIQVHAAPTGGVTSA
jgi:hypothetical protein